MKSIITTALILGLTLISCPTGADTSTSADSTYMNPSDSSPMPSDTMSGTSSGTGDTMSGTGQNRDSATTTRSR